MRGEPTASRAIVQPALTPLDREIPTVLPTSLRVMRCWRASRRRRGEVIGDLSTATEVHLVGCLAFERAVGDPLVGVTRGKAVHPSE